MPITKGAKKAMRASWRKKGFNTLRKDAMKEAIKSYRTSPNAAALSVAFKTIDKAAKRGVIKQGNASRKKSRLARLLVSK
ncbi:MAG TPA: 30S ribosomal protein S20 [Candidatus Paceibacterota bacterium]